MKKNYRTILVAMAVALAIGLSFVSFRVSAAAEQSANGQGTLLGVDENGRQVRRTFSFSVRRQADGTVQGTANLHNPAFTGENGNSPYRLQIDVSCMKIVGNIAYMGGMTRRTNDPNLVDAVYFAVQDNGEPGKDRDKISRVLFFDDDPNTTGDPQLCQNHTDPTSPQPIETIVAGNIQVRP